MQNKNYLIGYDIGSSSVKASIIDASNGECVATGFYPETEMPIDSPQAGWAEQNPEMWWSNLKATTQQVLSQSKIDTSQIKAIGIAYQMHGLVMLDEDLELIRDSIIWCDSRAVEHGNRAFLALGEEDSLKHLLNSPGNFTLSKLAWVKENEKNAYAKVRYYMLPGDYIALKMTSKATTTITGLSEGIAWDFPNNKPASFLFEHWGFDESMIPEIVPVFGEQGFLSAKAASELGLKEGTPITYRAGDQPNNALSLNVLHPGELAATAGTSGVVYAVSSSLKYDPQQRVNSFAHVNHSEEKNSIGVLLCINGTAILNKWIKDNVAPEGISYVEMNELAMDIPIGSEGVCILPFGNGAERVLNNREVGCSIHGIDFNRTGKAHLIRAAQEGIAFSFKYGMDMMKDLDIDAKVIKAGYANLFLSPIFRQTLANITGATIELYNTDGSIGSARGAGIGLGVYASPEEAFSSLKKIEEVKPKDEEIESSLKAYNKWLTHLKQQK